MRSPFYTKKKKLSYATNLNKTAFESTHPLQKNVKPEQNSKHKTLRNATKHFFGKLKMFKSYQRRV